MTRLLLASFALCLAASAAPAAEESAFKNTENGTPKIGNIDVIAFGSGGALLIGDGKGSQLVAVDTKDTKAKPWKADAIEKIDAKLAAKIGTTAKNLEIVHMTVNPASGTAYIAVRKQDEKSKTLILTVDGDGKINEFTLEKVDHVAVPLPKGEKGAIYKVTDLAWAKGRILVGGAANEEFGSKVYSIPTPLDSTKKAEGFSTETYHVAHRKWETRAPMTSLMPLEQKGKQYVVGAFACTPVVRYPLEDIKPGAKVKGTSVVELGSGNRPLNMFSYKKGDKSYVLMNTFRMHHARKAFGPSPYWVARIDLDIFDETEKVNEKAQWRIDKEYKPITDKVKMVEEYHGVAHMDRLGEKQALVIQEKDKVWTLKALDLP